MFGMEDRNWLHVGVWILEAGDCRDFYCRLGVEQYEQYDSTSPLTSIALRFTPQNKGTPKLASPGPCQSTHDQRNGDIWLQPSSQERSVLFRQDSNLLIAPQRMLHIQNRIGGLYNSNLQGASGPSTCLMTSEEISGISPWLTIDHQYDL